MTIAIETTEALHRDTAIAVSERVREGSGDVLLDDERRNWQSVCLY